MKRVFGVNDASMANINNAQTMVDASSEGVKAQGDASHGTMSAHTAYVPNAQSKCDVPKGTYTPHKKTACIVIPVYKETLSKNELLSLNRCFTVLKNHPIFLVTHAKLDISVYKDQAQKAGVSLLTAFFDKSFFKNISSYNRLMKSLSFYRTFNDYEYMLIYQLDAWVFTDALTEWCARGFDYIGSPWTKGDVHPLCGGEFVLSGNGGFSLRRVAYFTELLREKGRIFTKEGITAKIDRLKAEAASCRRLLGRIVIWAKILAYRLGILNRMRFLCRSTWTEDQFFIENFSKGGTFFPLNVPEPSEAQFFAFEQFPSYLYEQTNHVLPFGAHAWHRFEYESFWRTFIPTES